ncbi:MAG: DUF2628 domain-containing protein [Oscillospiraceae bacterium]|nr:DUF2628 domain-containing protein [Oscillospiraceae bacterium]
MKYIGYDCPVCGKPFAQGEDIVVCPVCGAPHHRECYKQKGGCGLEENHAKGIAWEDHVKNQAPRQQSTQGSGNYSSNSYQSSNVQRCPSCGIVNPADGIFCQVCGTMLQRSNAGFGGAAPFQQQGRYQQQQQYDPGYTTFSPYAGMNPEDKLGEATVREVSTYVGPASHFYLSRFRLSVKNNNRNMSFCWSGFLFGPLYFFYRKVYRVAIPLLILFLFSILPSFVYSYEYLREAMLQYTSLPFPLPTIETPALQQLATISNFAQFGGLIVSAIMGFTGHKIYLNDINRKIAKIKARCQGVSTDEYISTLAREGGVSTVLTAVLVGVLVLGYFAASMAIAVILQVNL